MTRGRRSLKSRFVFLVTALILLVMALDAVVLLHRERSSMLRALVARARALGLIVDRLVSARAPAEVAALRPVLEAAARGLFASGLTVRTDAGERLVALDDPAPPGAKPHGEGILIDEIHNLRYYFAFSDHVALRVPCRFADGSRGAIEARFSLEETREGIRDILRQTLILLFVTLASGFFMSSFLSGIILTPLHRFILAARQVAEGDEPQPIEAEGGAEIADLAESFNRMIGRLRQKRELEERLTHKDKLATVGQIAAAVAHEVRNPLVSIRSLAELLADDFRGQEAERHLAVIVREVDRINGVTERLLNYAKPRKRAVEAFDPSDVTDDMVMLVKPHARKKSARLAAVYGHRGAVRMGRDDLSQITLNLLMNALEAIGQGGAVTVETADEGDKVALLVRDDGRGMEPEECARIFKPFVTGAGGTGLGLTIVEQLVRENGGTIEVASAPGRGTTFTLRFPALRERV